MKYLLDTHTLLWVAMNQKKLSEQAKNILLGGNPKFVSQITLWEISLKYSLKKLDLKGLDPQGLISNSKKFNIKILSLSTSLAISFYKLPRYSNKDPFDRMIAWQAINEDMILISKDKEFDYYNLEGLKRIW